MPEKGCPTKSDQLNFNKINKNLAILLSIPLKVKDSPHNVFCRLFFCSFSFLLFENTFVHCLVFLLFENLFQDSLRIALLIIKHFHFYSSCVRFKSITAGTDMVVK